MFLPRSPAQTVRSQLFEAEAAPATSEPGSAGPSDPPVLPDTTQTADAAREEAGCASSAVSPAEARASTGAERVAPRERPANETTDADAPARAIARAELEALCAAHADDPVVQTLLARARALDAALEQRARK